MTSRRSTVVWPGTARLTLALLAIVPAAMAYPWQSIRDRWLLGIAAAVVIVLFTWWRGLHLTTILRRRLAMMRPNRAARPMPELDNAARTTVLLSIAPPENTPDVLPLPLIAGYLNRYGITADTIRVTSRDTDSDAGARRRQTWIGLTLSAADNLSALQARSPRIPLRETAEVAARRLADHLREIGWTVGLVEPDDVPQVCAPNAPETWSAVWEGNADYVAAYRVTVDAALPDTLAAIWSEPAHETWTAVEIAGAGTSRTLAVACALRTETAFRSAPRLPGLTPQRGNHRTALRALDPLSTERLDGADDAAGDMLTQLHWPSAVDGIAQSPSRPRHAAASRT